MSIIAQVKKLGFLHTSTPTSMQGIYNISTISMPADTQDISEEKVISNKNYKKIKIKIYAMFT